MNIHIKYLNDTLRLVSNVFKSIVSIIPAQKVSMKPNKKSRVFVRDEDIKPDYEKHYHKPYSKPAVEKQKFRKESYKRTGSFR